MYDNWPLEVRRVHSMCSDLKGKKVMRKFTKIYFLKFQLSIKILKKYFISLNDNKVPPIPSDMEICKLQLV